MVSKLVVATALAGLAATWGVLRSRQRSGEDDNSAAKVPADRLAGFWGVRLTAGPGSTACARAQEAAGSEYPLDQVPTLPLAGCSSLNCRCHFIYLANQRSGQDRRGNSDRRDAIRFDTNRTNRRSGHDRRRRNDLWRDS